MVRFGRSLEGGVFGRLTEFFRRPKRFEFRGIESGGGTRLSAIYGNRLRVSGSGSAARRNLRDLERLPNSFHQKLAGYFAGHPKGGIDIIDGSVTDVMPELRGVRPRGWSLGQTWSRVPGLHDPSTRRVIAGGKGSHASYSLALHETGHALDEALGGASQSAEFTQLHSKLTGMSPYYTQPGVAGRQETFAEGLAAWGLNHHMPGDNRAAAIADTLGIRTDKLAQGALLDNYFRSLQKRLGP